MKYLARCRGWACLLTSALALLACVPATGAVIRKLDVVFAFDATGSMSGEINTCKTRSIEIMERIKTIVGEGADCQFGVVSIVDYPSWYCSYGYSETYGMWGDYAYRTDQNITADTEAVSEAINSLYALNGGDGPQDYTRLLYELTQPYDDEEKWGIDWRPGARRIAVMFGDAPAHDPGFFSESYGGDPGRDEEMFTDDDLDYESIVAQVGAAGISVMTVDSSYGDEYDTGYDHDAWLNFEYIAKQTGGVHYKLERSAEIPDAIVGMIEDTSYDVAICNPYSNGFTWQKECQLHAHFRFDVPWEGWKKGLGQPAWNWDDDGAYPPATKVSEVERLYAERGYSYVAITEHNETADDPTTWTTNHVRYCEEVSADDFHLLAIGMDGRPSFDISGADRAAARERVEESVLAWGGIAIAAHPNLGKGERRAPLVTWAPVQLLSLAKSGRHSSMEIFNNSSDVMYRLDSAASWYAFNRWVAWAERSWDWVLSKRVPMWGVATDDYTPNRAKLGLDGGCIRILTASDATDQDDFERCLRSGQFYATQGSGGPRIKSVGVDEVAGEIQVTTEGKSIIRFIGAPGIDAPLSVRGGYPAWLHGVESASYKFNGSETYVRVEAIQGDKHSWSQPIFIDKRMSKQRTLASPARITVGDAILSVDGPTGAQVTASTVATSELPEVAPPGGYFGDVYHFEADDGPLTDLSVSITYREAEVAWVKPERLAIYQYDRTSGSWVELTSTLNSTLRTVTATPAVFATARRAKDTLVNLWSTASSRSTGQDLGLIALSARDEVDTQAPAISLATPSNAAGLSEKTILRATASDDNGVVLVRFFRDDVQIASDSFGPDGWSSELDPATVLPGAHILTAEAVDAAGNSAVSDPVEIIVPTGDTAPAVAILFPPGGAKVWSAVALTGTAADDHGISDVIVSVDGSAGAIAARADADWSAVAQMAGMAAGEHTITVTAYDPNMNSASATTTVFYEPPALLPGMSMASIPLQMNPGEAGVVVGSQPVQLARWSAAARQYKVYPRDADYPSIGPGQGWWLQTSDPAYRTELLSYGVPVDQTQPFHIPLEKGWNQIGCPFLSAVTWNADAVKVSVGGAERTLYADAQLPWTERWVADYLWGYDGSQYSIVGDTRLQSVRATGQIEPWKGYWIRARVACDLIIPAPAAAADAVGGAR